MNSSKTKNYVVEFLRLVFMILICFHHFQPHLNIKIVNSAYLGVEFFFILSGFYLYKSFNKSKKITSWNYTINKIKKYFLPYAIAMIVTIVANIICNGLNIEKTMFIPVGEILMLQTVRNIFREF